MACSLTRLSLLCPTIEQPRLSPVTPDPTTQSEFRSAKTPSRAPSTENLGTRRTISPMPMRTRGKTSVYHPLHVCLVVFPGSVAASGSFDTQFSNADSSTLPNAAHSCAANSAAWKNERSTGASAESSIPRKHSAPARTRAGRRARDPASRPRNQEKDARSPVPPQQVLHPAIPP